MPEKFDWTQHMHDRLGNVLIRMMSLHGTNLETFGLTADAIAAEKAKDITIEVKINGVEVNFKDFVDATFAVDTDALCAAARDVLEERLGTKLDAIENTLSKIRQELDSGDIVRELEPDWKRIVEQGPKR